MPPEREDALRILIAAIVTLGFHILLFQAFMFKMPELFDVKEDVIAIELVTLPPSAQGVQPAEEKLQIDDAPLPPPPNVKPRPKPAPPTSPTISSQAPDILASSRRALADDTGNTVPLSEAGISPSLTPPERSVDDIRIDNGLKALAAELACLNGFSTDCTEIRKDVFEEYQLTETEKVYTKKYAHTGMPVEFYGMSERQIREKLNLKFAGENGIYIPFTNIGIDGGLWDAMHGVNKGCEWKAGITPDGNHAPIKDCPGYLPAAKEDRDRRNKFKPKVNE